ncbi:MAG: DUF5723 family protein [Bacteroidota bacterium]
MKIWKFLITGILVFSGLNSFSQEMWGIANSNYAGTMGHELNPASIVANPFKWEIHFLSADVSVMNNYMFLKRNSRAIRLGVRGESVNEERFTDNYTKNDKKAFGSAYIKLPSLMYSGKKWGLGFHVSTKVGLSATGIPYHLAKFMKEGFDYTPQQQINYSGGNAAIAAMNYNEAGITGGLLLMDDKTSFLTGGITLNYLYGMNSVYLLINDINYNVQADTLWQIYVANAEYGHASVDGGNNGASDALSKKGGGFSTSVGVQYYRNRNDAAYNPCFNGKAQKKYDYKIGFSLIDIGRIKWNTNAHKYVFDDVSTDWFGIDTLKLGSFSASDSTFNTQFYGLPEAGLTANTYNLFTPAAASMQFDYAYSPNIYFNFSVIQRLPLSDYMIKRPNQISITARYETKRFEIAIPYSLYDYYRNRIGLAIRYGVFTLGTDMIGPYTGISNAFGVDIYFGIKWQIYQSCNRKSGKQSKSKGGPAQGCFNDF